ncbi:MAG: tRNA (adenosine(37)-N6)-threonylcarbamoyltransferase complex transferase subunit TsaD [Deltaproteobacteria bacterium]|nr:tRNA (adenosine(37)-N6)-threonylcarbamoyltransferase complex transferase subunit TsaD [Deltaproteobacteria bacterium]
MLILGIESSCDETAAAVVQDGSTIRSNIISSQIDLHARYGGVVPEIASRSHQETIIPVINEALSVAGVDFDDLDGIAVTQGPGLVGSLLVGINAAKAIAYARQLPIVGINHLEGHLLAPRFEHNIEFPNITLVVSGGHTNLYLVNGPGSYELLGKTRDDAAGEAFDKIAKLLDLGYPGGVVIDKMAKRGSSNAVAFPRPMLKDKSLDFSFSGLKTAVRYHVESLDRAALTDAAMNDIVASFQEAVVEILVEKSIKAAQLKKACAITIAGGVAANSRLRSRLTERGSELNIPVYIPSPVLCTDNAAMIALAGEYHLKPNHPFPYDMNARSRWPING